MPRRLSQGLRRVSVRPRHRKVEISIRTSEREAIDREIRILLGSDVAASNTAGRDGVGDRRDGPQSSVSAGSGSKLARAKRLIHTVLEATPRLRAAEIIAAVINMEPTLDKGSVYTAISQLYGGGTGDLVSENPNDRMKRMYSLAKKKSGRAA